MGVIKTKGIVLAQHNMSDDEILSFTRELIVIQLTHVSQ